MFAFFRYFLNGRSLTAKIVDGDSIHADMFKVTRQRLRLFDVTQS
jgi:hypothetical protein